MRRRASRTPTRRVFARGVDMELLHLDDEFNVAAMGNTLKMCKHRVAGALRIHEKRAQGLAEKSVLNDTLGETLCTRLRNLQLQ